PCCDITHTLMPLQHPEETDWAEHFYWTDAEANQSGESASCQRAITQPGSVSNRRANQEFCCSDHAICLAPIGAPKWSATRWRTTCRSPLTVTSCHTATCHAIHRPASLPFLLAVLQDFPMSEDTAMDCDSA